MTSPLYGFWGLLLVLLSMATRCLWWWISWRAVWFLGGGVQGSSHPRPLSCACHRARYQHPCFLPKEISCRLTSGWSPRLDHHGCSGTKRVTWVLKWNGSISAHSLLFVGWSRGHSRSKAGGLHTGALCLLPPLLESHEPQVQKKSNGDGWGLIRMAEPSRRRC